MQSGTQPPRPPAVRSTDDAELREAFQSFVGQTLFGQMLQSMRKTVGKPAYFHGGRTEEIFQQQLDQVLAEKIAEASAEKLAEPMYALFTANRR
jgi:Rod binding domain-containing protein